MSSFSPVSHSWEDLHNVFVEKLHFTEIRESNGIKYYEDPDTAIQTLQINTKLDKPYIDDKVEHIGFSYKVFRWLLNKSPESSLISTPL
jgi:hypothetical protein